MDNSFSGNYARRENLVAVTIGVGPRWRALAELSAQSVRAQTGLPTVILGERHMAEARLARPHHLKFRLFDLVPQADAILYFDADTIFLRRWDPRALLYGPQFVAVADRATHASVQNDAAQIGMPVQEYFNSGLFLAQRAHHHALLHKAHYYDGHFASIFHDQTALNAARHRARIPLRLLSREYNWLDFDRSTGARPIVGHFWKIDELPIAEAARCFRDWASRAGDAPRRAPQKLRAPSAKTAARSAEETRHGQLLEQALAKPARYPEKKFAGRGIVICGGGEKYFPCAWVCIRILRALGCRLPIELWHLGPDEMRAEMRAPLAEQDVTAVDAWTVPGVKQRLGGWELKAVALAHSRFAEVLQIDADNVPVRDPSFLFDAPEYAKKGAIFWPDFNRLGPDRPIWRVLDLPYRDEPEVESGQLLVNKSKCWRAVQIALHLNAHSDFYYRYVLGDKETFHLAWRKVGLDYAMPARGVTALSATMCQYDLEGRLLFQHRSFAKWQLHGENRRILGFEREEQCLAFLAELRARWQPPAAERTTADKLCARTWHFRRGGRDERLLTFLPDGTIAADGADAPLTWELQIQQSHSTLEIFAADRKTLTAILDPDSIWRGRSLLDEGKPEVELVPNGAAPANICLKPAVILKNALPFAPAQGRTAARPASATVEAVVVHWRRPQNLLPLLTALRAQTAACRITLLDVHDDDRHALPEATLAMADEVFRWHTNHGGFNRFVPALSFAAEYTWFVDDDLAPGPRCLEHLLAHARALKKCGALGQLGRRFPGDRYDAHDVPRALRAAKVDCLVRGYLVPTRHLAHVAAVRWQHPELFYPGMGEDDLVLALALHRAGLPLYITPRDADPATRLDAATLPEPFALSHRQDHLARRDAFVRKYFAVGAKPRGSQRTMAAAK